MYWCNNRFMIHVSKTQWWPNYLHCWGDNHVNTLVYSPLGCFPSIPDHLPHYSVTPHVKLVSDKSRTKQLLYKKNSNTIDAWPNLYSYTCGSKLIVLFWVHSVLISSIQTKWNLFKMVCNIKHSFVMVKLNWGEIFHKCDWVKMALGLNNMKN